MSVELAVRLWQMRAPRVLVVGDRVTDRDLFVSADRFAQEAPGVPVWRVERREERPGGAAAVACMVEGLGGSATLVDGWRESRKTRVYVNGRMAARYDEDAGEVPPQAEKATVEMVKAFVPDADCVLVADYFKGVCLSGVVSAAIRGALEKRIPCVVDPARGLDWDVYAGATAIKCNQSEWQEASFRSTYWEDVTDCVVVTDGAQGMTRMSETDAGGVYPARPRDAVCVLGCGDMVLSALGVCLAGGMTWDEACRVAVSASGLKVCRRGAVPVSRAEVCLDLLHPSKLLPAELLPAVRKAADGKKVVWTNGVYDLLHPGHVHCLTEAKKQGNILVVGVNADASVRRLKGEGRPLVPLEHRVASLAALACVDWVVPFGDDGCDDCTPLVEALGCDVLVKGSEYGGKPIDGAAAVLACGGRVHLVEMLAGCSTTALAAKASHP